MANHNGMQFSTLDSDNDNTSRDCANKYGGHGGWWYNGCFRVVLNGKNYGENTSVTKYQGIIWSGFKTGSKDSWSSSLKSVTMVIRPNDV